MFLIGGIATGRKDLPFHQVLICPKCGRLSSISVFMVYSCFSFFFIPLFQWGKKYYTVSSCCGSVCAIDAAKGRAIEQGSTDALTPEELTIVGTDASAARCPDCGYPLSPEFDYCPKCGRKR